MTRDEFEQMLDDHAFGWIGTSEILAEYDRLVAERNGLAKLSGRLAVECGIYKQALEEINFSHSACEDAFQISLDALNKANGFKEAAIRAAEESEHA